MWRSAAVGSTPSFTLRGRFSLRERLTFASSSSSGKISSAPRRMIASSSSMLSAVCASRRRLLPRASLIEIKKHQILAKGRESGVPAVPPLLASTRSRLTRCRDNGAPTVRRLLSRKPSSFGASLESVFHQGPSPVCTIHRLSTKTLQPWLLLSVIASRYLTGSLETNTRMCRGSGHRTPKHRRRILDPR